MDVPDFRCVLGNALDALQPDTVLVVRWRDRLARAPHIQDWCHRRAMAAGAWIESTDETGSGDGPMDELVRGIVASLSRYRARLARIMTSRGLLRNQAMAGHGLERVEHVGGDQLVRHGPLEQALDTADVLIDAGPCQAAIDHRLPDGREPPGAEVGGGSPAEELSQWPECQAEVMQLAGGPAVGGSVAQGRPLPEGGKQLRDGQTL